MKLDKIRKKIDETDGEILRLFSERMELCEQVADYKKKNGMPVFQGGREKQVLDGIEAKTEPHLRSASRLLFSQIMEISKCLQTERLTEYERADTTAVKPDPKIACPGIRGSYTEEACRRVFGKNARIDYYDTFEQVFGAVSGGEAEYGIVPIENSTAGGVDGTYELFNRYDIHICRRLSIPVNHVLAARSEDCVIGRVVSHEQALHQCQGFLKELGCETAAAPNTSIAARDVAESGDESIACICSQHCADLYGLKVLKREIADNNDNFTRFIVISKDLQIEENADMISVCLSLPHVTGSLYRLLTKFNYCGLNLTKIESRPMPKHIKQLFEAAETDKENFEVIFYLDFEGSLSDPSVSKLLKSLEKECVYYRFLGNYRDMDKKG
ncbi:MAG: chorismate mutase [Bacteroides sp.]|nr:chorismate mutase [Bacteroides sp.]